MVTPPTSLSPGASSSAHVAADMAQVVNTSTSHPFRATRCSHSIRSQCSVPPTTSTAVAGDDQAQFHDVAAGARDGSRTTDDGKGVSASRDRTGGPGRRPCPPPTAPARSAGWSSSPQSSATTAGIGRRHERDGPVPVLGRRGQVGDDRHAGGQALEHGRRCLPAGRFPQLHGHGRPVEPPPPLGLVDGAGHGDVTRRRPGPRARSPMTWARIGGQGPTKATRHPARAAASTRRSGRLAIDTTPKATTTGPARAPDAARRRMADGGHRAGRRGEGRGSGGGGPAGQVELAPAGAPPRS